MIRGRTTAAAAAVLALGLAAPAQARIFERFEDSGEGTVTEELCGMELQLHFEFEVRGTLRQGKNRLDQAFFTHDKYHFVNTYTDPATGASFSIEGRGNFREVSAKPLGGTLFEFKLKESGATQTVRDADGRVVLKDRGTIHSTVVFDTLGDDKPGGTVLSFTDDRISGPHPIFESTQEETCALYAELLET